MPPITANRLPAAPGAIASLGRWRPLQALVVLAGLALGIPAARMAVRGGAVANHTLDIDTQGAQGSLEDGQLTLDLPVSVTNGSEHVILGVTLWVRAYACRDAASPTADCTPLLSTEQALPMRVMPGESTSLSQSLTSGLPEHLAGKHLRILRKLERVEDDTDETSRLRAQRLGDQQLGGP